MDEKKKGKKKETSDSNEGHKKPWQEVYATPEEIKAMLANRVSLRYNEVRGRTEIHYYSRGPEIRVDDQGLLTIFGGDGGVTDGYQNLTVRTWHRSAARATTCSSSATRRVRDGSCHHNRRERIQMEQRFSEILRVPCTHIGGTRKKLKKLLFHLCICYI